MPTIYIENKDKLPERKEFDLYPTPIEFCKAALNVLPKKFKPFNVLDPGCGDGVWGDVVASKYNTWITGVDIRDVNLSENYDYFYKEDFLNFTSKTQFDLIIGNPPYKYAEEFLDKSFELVSQNGYILFLYRLTFLESLGRYSKYFNAHLNPLEVHVSTRRLGFTRDKKGGPDAYALFLWKSGWNSNNTILKWLDWNYE